MRVLVLENKHGKNLGKLIIPIMAEVVAVASDVPAKKLRKNTKKVLDQKKSSTNEANILAQTLATESSASDATDPMKENRDSISSAKKGKAVKGGKKQQQQKQSSSSFENELEQMQEMLQQLKLEKEKTEEMLKEKDEMLKAREDELENKGKEQEKLQAELKKLQKMKEFKPNLHFEILRDGEQANKSKNKKNKKKDGAEMKRPSTPYILWSKDQWAQVKKENPNADFKEFPSILGAKWKSVTAEEKKPYEEKYRAEKEAYLQVTAMEKRENEAMRLLEEEQKQKTAMELLEQYMQYKNEADDQANKKTKKERDPLKPKQPMSAFFIFSNERWAALHTENKNVTEVAKIAGEEWKTMTEKQKAPYEEMAKKNKESYLIEMEAYKLKKEEEAMTLKKEEEEVLKLQKQEAMQLLKKKEKADNIIKKTKEDMQKKKKNQNADPNKPKKPATSFLLFSKEARKNLMQERPGINNSTLTALISVKWKELSGEEREIWNAKAGEAMDVYKKEMEEYNKSCAENQQ
ncbi:High mobility group B protein 13 [Linum perenne]